MSNKSDFVLGNIEVHSTQNKGHDPEFWAAQATKKIACTADGDTATPVPSTAVTLLTAPAIDKELIPPAFHAPWFQPALPQPVPKIMVTEDIDYANLIMALFASLAGY